MPLLGSRGAASTTGFGGLTKLGYLLRNSLRFRSSASAYLSRTFAANPTTRTQQTFSFWTKRGSLGSTQVLFGGYDGSSVGAFIFNFTSSDTLQFFYGGSAANNIITTQVFRDPSAWYHIVASIDSTQSTASNRVKIYVNGVQITAFGTTNYPPQNTLMQFALNNANNKICNNWDNASNPPYDGYLAEINFIDGQALTPSSFGKTDAGTGQWVPIKYTGTYGTNGFYLPFTNTTSTSTLGNDFSGNSNTWTVNNISLTAGSTYDSMTDVPTLTNATTANYATFNPVYKATSQPTFSNGNLTIASNAGAYQNSFSTIGIFNGKFYWETKITGTTSSANYIGVSSSSEVNYLVTNSSIVGATSTGYSCAISNGDKYSNSSQSAYGSSLSSGDILMCALDLTNGGIYWGKNGTWFNSGNPATQTNPAFTGLSGEFFPGFTTYTHPTLGVMTYDVNFGQRPFAYTPPTGFKALNTFNLP